MNEIDNYNYLGLFPLAKNLLALALLPASL